MGITLSLALLIIVGAAMLIRAKTINADTSVKRRLAAIGCALIAIHLAFTAYLVFILLPSM